MFRYRWSPDRAMRQPTEGLRNRRNRGPTFRQSGIAIRQSVLTSSFETVTIWSNGRTVEAAQGQATAPLAATFQSVPVAARNVTQFRRKSSLRASRAAFFAVDGRAVSTANLHNHQLQSQW